MILPVLVIILYAIVDIGLYLLAQQRVGRAAASLADLIVNETKTYPDEFALFSQIGISQQFWLPIVRDIVGYDENSQGQSAAQAISVMVVYRHDDIVADYVEDQAGICPDPSRLREAVANKALDTPDSIAPLDFVAVKVCFRYADNNVSVANLVLPQIIESRFLTLRKAWNQTTSFLSPPALLRSVRVS